MPFRTRFAAAAISLAAFLASPAHAQIEIARGVAFFERIDIGNLDIAAANVFYDDRCVDIELCFRSDSMAISVVMFTDEGLREVILKLGERAKVPGGHLVLTRVGAPPSRNGAIALEDYSLELVFVPTPERQDIEGS